MSEALAGKTWMLGKVSWLGEIQWQRTKIIWRNPHSQIWRDTLEPHLGCWWNISPFGLCSLTAWCWGSKKHLPKRTRQEYIFYDLPLKVIWYYFHWSHTPTQIQGKGTQHLSVGSHMPHCRRNMWDGRSWGFIILKHQFNPLFPLPTEKKFCHWECSKFGLKYLSSFPSFIACFTLARQNYSVSHLLNSFLLLPFYLNGSLFFWPNKFYLSLKILNA